MNSRSGNNSGTKKKEYAENESRAKAAKAASVNPRYVSDAKAIKEAAPDLIEKVKVGDLSIPEAKKELAARALPKDTGDLILDADDLPVPDHLREHWRTLNATVNAILLPLRKVQAEIHAGMDRLMKLEAEAVAAGKAPHSSKAIRDALKVGTIQRGTAIAPKLRMESERVRTLISDVLDLAPAVWCKPCQGAGSVDAVVCANCKGRGFYDKRAAVMKKLTTPRTA